MDARSVNKNTLTIFIIIDAFNRITRRLLLIGDDRDLAMKNIIGTTNETLMESVY